MAAPFVLAGVTGLLLGSFLNVVAHRLPLGASLVKPRSACPGCSTPVRPYDNVPVLSWLLLRGRCRDCAAPISGRYPLVEAGTALLWLAVTLVHLADPAKLVLGLVLVTFLVPLTLIDLEHRLLPDRLTGAAAILLLLAGLALDPGGQIERLIAAAGAAGFLFAAAVVYPGDGMGGGDIKLAGVLGLALGGAVAPALLVALIAGTLVGVAVMARLGVEQGRKTPVPFGPFLALGGVVAVLVGEPMVQWYLGTFA